MKFKILALIIVVFSLALFLTGCFCEGVGVVIEKQDSEPSQYTNVTVEEMERFPALKKAIDKNLSFASESVNSEEEKDLKVFFDIGNNKEKFFKYEDKYYKIYLEYALC